MLLFNMSWVQGEYNSAAWSAFDFVVSEAKNALLAPCRCPGRQLVSLMQMTDFELYCAALLELEHAMFCMLCYANASALCCQAVTIADTSTLARDTGSNTDNRCVTLTSLRQRAKP